MIQINMKKIGHDKKGRDVYKIVKNEYVEDVYISGSNEMFIEIDEVLYSLYLGDPFLPMYKMSNVIIS